MDDAHSDQRQAGALDKISKSPIWGPVTALTAFIGAIGAVVVPLYIHFQSRSSETTMPVPQTETTTAPLTTPPVAQPPSAPAPTQAAQTAPPAVNEPESSIELHPAPKEDPRPAGTTAPPELTRADTRQAEPPPAAKPDPLPEPRTAVQEPAHDMPPRPLETPAPKTDEQDDAQDIEIASRSDPAVAVPMHRTPQRETRAAAPATPRSINVMASETFSLCGYSAFRAKPSSRDILLENQDRTFPFRRQKTLAPWTYRVTSAAPVQVFPGCIATFNVQISHGAQYVAITEQPDQRGQ